MMMLKEIEGLGHKQFSRTPEAEALAQPSIELPGNDIEIGLRETGEVGCLGPMLNARRVPPPAL